MTRNCHNLSNINRAVMTLLHSVSGSIPLILNLLTRDATASLTSGWKVGRITSSLLPTNYTNWAAELHNGLLLAVMIFHFYYLNSSVPSLGNPIEHATIPRSFQITNGKILPANLKKFLITHFIALS